MSAHENKMQLEKADKKYVWHPFTQMKDWERDTPVIIEEGEGCFIKDVNGKWYLDGVSSLWVNNHGHRKKEIDEAIIRQLGKIAHSTILGLSSVPAIELAERLMQCIDVTINNHEKLLAKVFYSDNGSTAVEVALKMAFQYWQHKGDDRKQSFISLNNAYHGDTLGAVSVGGVDIFHKTFAPLLFKTFRAPSPYCYRCELGKQYPDCGFYCVEKSEEVLREHHEKIAAFIIEPLIQAAGGMIVFPQGYLKRISKLCRKYDVLLIADEVATGFGRTGKMFACEHEGVTPDILCLSKGITGGYMPLAVTVASQKIYDAFLGEFSELKTFFHGHSYTGNPLGCAAALACLDIYEKEKTLDSLAPKVKILEDRLAEMSELQHVGNVRNIGLMAGVELVRDKDTKEPYDWAEKMGWRVAYHARDKGVFIRPLGNVIVIMPPLSISHDDLDHLLKVIRDAILAVT